MAVKVVRSNAVKGCASHIAQVKHGTLFVSVTWSVLPVNRHDLSTFSDNSIVSGS